ncbi:hypothetical protein CHS0354_020515 [Potamilus streckersoni]|uniref:Uncharacterized protein n=1 Tax=Potamilus streckersoni TaxID=2493646 RepID=A0AAE0SIB3_9BIVA|nr:hypothetical protein CHS0354_020515 [Potamilus streckersoni]
MAGLDESSLCGKVAKILAGIAFLFHLIGFASPYWRKAVYDGYTDNSGLWKTCRSGGAYLAGAVGCANHTHTTGIAHRQVNFLNSTKHFIFEPSPAFLINHFEHKAGFAVFTIALNC